MNESTLLNRFWTIPNILSLLRILLIFPILYLFRYPHLREHVFVLTVIAYFTDFLDGFLARKLRCQSRIGTLLDPIGDKLLAVTLAAVLYIKQEVPFLFFVVVAARDIIIAVGAIYALNMYRYVFLPLIVGKLTTFALGAFYCSLIFAKTSWSAGLPWIERVNGVVLYVVIGLVVFSGLVYVWNYLRYFLESKKKI